MMKLFLVFASALCISATLSAQTVRHVILITIDGMRPEFYQDPSWPAPTIQHMMQEGAYALKVRPVFPSVTLPNHTAMITGALPARHGVTMNSPFTPLSSAPSWYFDANIIRSTTLFQALHHAGLTSASVAWPVTNGAPIDWDVPDYFALDDKTDNIALIRSAIHPSGLWDEIVANATGKIPGKEIDSDDFLRTDENTGRIGAYLFMTYKPSFLAMHLVQTDHAQHDHGREGYEVRAAVASADRAIAGMLEAVRRAGLQDSTTILVAGDHGFSDIHSGIFPNVWLARAGILHPAGPHWRAKFQSASGSAFLYLENPGDTAALTLIHHLFDTIPDKYRRLFRLVERPELDRLGADSAAFLAFAPEPGIAVGNSAEGEVLRAAHGGTHGFMTDNPEMFTGFIAYGAGIRKGTVIPLMGTQDIAPIIAKLLGIEFNCPDGILYPGLLKK